MVALLTTTLLACLCVVGLLNDVRQSSQSQPGMASPSIDKEVPSLTAVRGRIGAPVTVVVFADFECTHCAKLASVLDDLFNEYPEDLQLLFKHRPLAIHPNAQLAHEAALAAGVQGKFWEMHNLLFAEQGSLTRSNISRMAKQLQLEMTQFNEALQTRRYRSVVEHDLLEAKGLGVSATPTTFINGRRVLGAKPLAFFKELIEEEIGVATKAG